MAEFADTQELFMMFKVPGKGACSDLSKKNVSTLSVRKELSTFNAEK